MCSSRCQNDAFSVNCLKLKLEKNGWGSIIIILCLAEESIWPLDAPPAIIDLESDFFFFLRSKMKLMLFESSLRDLGTSFNCFLSNLIFNLWLPISILSLFGFICQVFRRNKESPFFCITSGLGRPIRIDPRSLRIERGRFTHVCVEIDITKPLIQWYLVWRILFEPLSSDFIWKLCPTDINSSTTTCPCSSTTGGSTRFGWWERER